MSRKIRITPEQMCSIVSGKAAVKLQPGEVVESVKFDRDTGTFIATTATAEDLERRERDRREAESLFDDLFGKILSDTNPFRSES